MNHRPKNDNSNTCIKHLKGLFLINKTECLYTAVQTGFLRKIGVQFSFENFEAICVKYHIKPGVSTVKIVEDRYWTRT